MSAKYAYSLNGENYIGSFDSREAAREAALAKSSGMFNPPASVFVAQVLAGDPQATGHAEGVIEEMRRRARELEGDDASHYLARVSTAEVQELDATLAKAVSTWLEKYRLTPKSFKIGAISEHPVPLPHRALSNHGNREVQDMGVGDYPQDSR